MWYLNIPRRIYIDPKNKRVYIWNAFRRAWSVETRLDVSINRVWMRFLAILFGNRVQTRPKTRFEVTWVEMKSSIRSGPVGVITDLVWFFRASWEYIIVKILNNSSSKQINREKKLEKLFHILLLKVMRISKLVLIIKIDLSNWVVLLFYYLNWVKNILWSKSWRTARHSRLRGKCWRNHST